VGDFQMNKFIFFFCIIFCSAKAFSCPDIAGDWKCPAYINGSEKPMADAGWSFSQKVLDNGDVEYSGIAGHGQVITAHSGTLIRNPGMSVRCDLSGLTIYESSVSEASQMTFYRNPHDPEKLIIFQILIGDQDFPNHMFKYVCTKNVK
jgi:hypothetical protein